MKKPTGTGKRPESVTRAKAIDKLINEKLATRNINDEDNVEDDENDPSQHSADEIAPDEDLATVRTVVARADRSGTQHRRRSRANQTSDLVGKITSALDPEAQRFRDEERAGRSLQTTHIFTLSQQL